MPRRIRSDEEKRRDRMAGYPEWFLGLASDLHAGLKTFTVKCDKHNIAINLRQRWHLFRKDLVFDKHPHANAAINTSVSVEDDKLIFTNIAHLGAEITRAVEAETRPIEGGRFEGPSFPIPVGNAPGDDALEELVRNTYSTPAQPAQDSACVHEPDPATGSFCLKCRCPL